MAIKRTKKQKQKTSTRREEILAYSIDEIQIVNKKNSGDKKESFGKVKKVIVSDGFDTSFIFKDILKTLILAVLVVGVLVAYTILGQ